MSNTATHNGTCQACGRQHAVNPKSGKLAKHGYTVDWGFFNGTCSGSDRKPLQHDDSFCLEVIADLNDRAAKLDAEAAGEILKVSVQTDSKRVNGKRRVEYKLVDRAEFEATQPSYHKFDDVVEWTRRRLRNQAGEFRLHAEWLDTLRSKVFGTDLIERPVEEPIKRETYGSYREAYQRVEALKAQGIAARQRREGWTQRYTVTYR